MFHDQCVELIKLLIMTDLMEEALCIRINVSCNNPCKDETIKHRETVCDWVKLQNGAQLSGYSTTRAHNHPLRLWPINKIPNLMWSTRCNSITVYRMCYILTFIT